MMATLAMPSEAPSPPLRQRSKSFARKCERYCCGCLSLFPLVFVLGLTSWAVWVQTHIGFLPAEDSWTGRTQALTGITLYLLLNWCYFTAVFTDPGSPISRSHNNAYTALPSQEPSSPPPLPTQNNHNASSLTAKSTGELRFCKKCRYRKPDRAHHCSTCRRCVLKMDHHCPWLATCVGFRNYKPFVLFLVYTCLFCYVCFAASVTWVWGQVMRNVSFEEQLMPVNYVLLAVLAGIIGLVLSGFTAWHLYLAINGQTTIESLEKIRYLSPVQKSRHQFSRREMHPVNPPPAATDADENAEEVRPDSPSLTSQLRTIHANALPGVTRPEEGEEESRSRTPSPTQSPAQKSLLHNYRNNNDDNQPSQYSASGEYTREQDRYAAYLEEQASSKLPNAFDHGWRRNLSHVFGPRPLFWFLPVCNTTGDGWIWEASQRWYDARREQDRERQARAREDAAFEEVEGRERELWQGQGQGHGAGRGGRYDPRQGLDGRGPPRYNYSDTPGSTSDVSMHTLPRNGSAHPAPPPRSTSTSPESSNNINNGLLSPPPQQRRANSTSPARARPPPGSRQASGSSSQAHIQTDNWNDLPDDVFNDSSSGRGGGSSSRRAGGSKSPRRPAM